MNERVFDVLNDMELATIRDLFFRNLALNELKACVHSDNVLLYEKLEKNITTLQDAFGSWWKQVSGRRHWEYGDDYQWRVDFIDGVIWVEPVIITVE